MIAYSFQSGHIEFGLTLAEGALPIAAHADEKLLREVVGVLCRWSYPTVPGGTDEKPLVPGIPEAEDSDAALEAHIVFADRVKEALDARNRTRDTVNAAQVQITEERNQKGVA